MNRLDELFSELGYDKDNGLFYLEDADTWRHKFPYRISRVLENIIKPYAFFTLCNGADRNDAGHPEPLNNPIILFFDCPDHEIERNIPKWTFSFSQAPVVVINRNDSLEIYHGYAFDDREREWLKKIDVDILEFSLANLITGRVWKKLYKKYFKDTHRVDKFLLRNIIDARRILIAEDSGGLPPRMANRLIGRSLFIRYLIDRRVDVGDGGYIDGDDRQQRQQSFEDLLGDKDKTYRFFNYITEKFNGDLFPLVERDTKGDIVYDEESTVLQEHLDVVRYLFSCASFFREKGSYKGYEVQRSLFRFYDFEVIPVELISNIYENFLGDSKKKENEWWTLGSRQAEIKSYYTPPFLVDYVLSQTVVPHLQERKTASCKVLDPACGSGIFLVEALRKIIEKEMQVNPVKVSDQRLWQLVQENIFGIDIDHDAIEITIFSLYITILDYKTPREIKNFRFEKLKDINLFGGPEADFFNEEHPFNRKFSSEVDLDFIIGNPPWGEVEISRYNDYIENRNKREKEKSQDRYMKLAIGNKEISQAFMVRVDDLIGSSRDTRCVLVVTGKNIYNTSRHIKTWRNYFLHKFFVTRLLELSSVNNKIVGGNKIFEAADQSPVVVSFYPAKEHEDTSNNIVEHIVARPNRFFNYFRTIVIGKHDYKRIVQKYFMESRGGYDWLWKVILHGNLLDFHFIKRLKEEFPTFGELIKRYDLEYRGGLKSIDNNIKPENRKSTETIKDWRYLEVYPDREFQPFWLNPTRTWAQKAAELALEQKIYENRRVGYLPDIYFFEGRKLLLKKGLLAGEDFKAVSAFSEDNLVFSSTVCSVKPSPGVSDTQRVDRILQNIVGVMNSKLFTYFILCSGSSVGIDRTRADFEEFFAFPIALNEKVAELTVDIQKMYRSLNANPLNNELNRQLKNRERELEETIMEAYHIDKQEEALIDYAIDIAIPVLKRGELREEATDIFNSLNLNNRDHKDYLAQYAGVFVEHFGKRFDEEGKYFVADIHVTSEFIGLHFRITKRSGAVDRIAFKADNDAVGMINKLGNLGLYLLSNDLYVQQDIRGFNENSFYVIKPNEKKLWHRAVAYADLSEFVEALVNSELKRHKK
jgi:hypothetical protein